MSSLVSRRKRAVLVAHDRPEALEPGAAERGILREQEIAAPEALARDRPVGLRVDGEDDARRVVGLRHAPHQHQQVPVRIGVHGPRAQRVLVQRHRIIIGVVVGHRRSPGAGMDGVGDDPQIPAERRRESRRLRRRSLRLRRSAVAFGRLRRGSPLAPAARGRLAEEVQSVNDGGVDDVVDARRGASRRLPAAVGGGSRFWMFHHAKHFGGWPPPPRVHFA